MIPRHAEVLKNQTRTKIIRQERTEKKLFGLLILLVQIC